MIKVTLLDVIANLKHETAEGVRLFFMPVRVVAQEVYRSVHEATDPKHGAKHDVPSSGAPEHKA